MNSSLPWAYGSLVVKGNRAETKRAGGSCCNSRIELVVGLCQRRCLAGEMDGKEDVMTLADDHDHGACFDGSIYREALAIGGPWDGRIIGRWADEWFDTIDDGSTEVNEVYSHLPQPFGFLPSLPSDG